MNLASYAQQYRQELYERIIPFWEEFGIDKVNGGYHCIISSKGEIVSTDKWVEWHGQQAYAYAKLFEYDDDPIFLHHARQGVDFLLDYATDTKGNWWYATDCTGRGIMPANDFCTQANAVVAWGLFFDLTLDQKYATVAHKTWLKTLHKREKLYQKQNTELLQGRQLKSIKELSLLAQALTAIRKLFPSKIFEEKADLLIKELMQHFWEPRAEILLENVPVQGGFSDCILGRHINPGRIFEAFNSFYELIKITNKRRLRQQLAKQVAYIAQTTWDENYGGYFSWMDIKNITPAHQEAYYKYAWVHLEACTALLRAYEILKDPILLRYWQRTNDYIWQVFPDHSPEGEWVGVLSRHGEPLYNLKATLDKSACYVVRNLLESATILERIS